MFDAVDTDGDGKVLFVDFIRMQLFRDVNVYHEVGRRAKLACADPSVGLEGFMSINEWIAMRGAGRRKLSAGPFDHAASIRKAAPNLADKHVERLHTVLADFDAKHVLVESKDVRRSEAGHRLQATPDERRDFVCRPPWRMGRFQITSSYHIPIACKVHHCNPMDQPTHILGYSSTMYE